MKLNVRMETLLTALALTLALGILASLEQSLRVSRRPQQHYYLAQATPVEIPQPTAPNGPLWRLRHVLTAE